MPGATTTTEFEAFVRRMPPAQMAELLIELSAGQRAVKERLLRLMLADNPRRLATHFRKSLTAWRRGRKFLAYRDAREFGREMEAWLEQLDSELLPRDPAAALELVESFIQSDESFFNRADDSEGAIGDAVRAGCRLWLKAAACCEAPAEAWPARLDALASADAHGAREALYRYAAELLPEAALRQLVRQHQAAMTAALAAAGDAAHLPVDVFRLSASLSLLARALRDPEVHVQAVLAYSPQPNANQMEGFVREYLDCGRPADALPWLDQEWGHLRDSRQRLRAEALSLLGRRTESAAVLQALFEKTLLAYDLTRWMDSLPPAEQPRAASIARERALQHGDPVAAARVLLQIGDPERAANVLVQSFDKINGQDYGSLLPLAQALEEQGCWSGAAAAYRALLDAILARAYAPAYSHAARYWQRLQALAERDADLGGLPPHEGYIAGIRRQHARKASFWAHVEGARGA
jgi:hypothetical protein